MPAPDAWSPTLPPLRLPKRCGNSSQPAQKTLRYRRLAGPLVAAIPLVVGCGSSSSITAHVTASASTSTRATHGAAVVPSVSSVVHLTSSTSCASVYPSPGTHSASSVTQISVRDVVSGDLSSHTVTVTGSKSGLHTGRWVSDSDHLGASFYPTKGFSAGETVSVSTSVRICGATGDSDTFLIAISPRPLAPVTTSIKLPRAPIASSATTYTSLPGMKIPTLAVKKAYNFGRSYLFETPRGGTIPAGLMIVNGKGQPVWFESLPRKIVATDLRVQVYKGHGVLTWWQGGVNPAGKDVGEFVMMNSEYHVIKTFVPGNGYAADEHEFLLSASGATAWVIGAQVTGGNLTGLGGPTNGAVVDEVAQEVDLATGNVLFEWHSLDHVPVKGSYLAYTPTAAYDFFHMNSIDPLSNGDVVISSRNTDAVFAVARNTGHVVWELGGKHSSFSMGPGAHFALQHDARMRGLTTISIFDDEDAAPSHAPARAIVLRLNFTTHRATLVRAISHSGLKVPWQGNQQILASGSTVAGWGSGSATSVYGRTGKLLFDATYAPPINSYRAYLLPWSGTPTTLPSIAASSARGTVNVFASWNGSTATTGWEVLGGASKTTLRPLARVGRTGFQTSISIRATPRFVRVVAVNASGRTLASSAVITPRTGTEPAVVHTP